MRSRVFMTLFLSMLVASAAVAGEKCSADAQTCLNSMAKKAQKGGWIGVDYERNAELGGWTITEVIENTPAVKAGFKKGDVVIEMNGVSCAEVNDELKAVLAEMRPGKTMTFKVARYGKHKTLKATFQSIPEDVAMRMVGEHMLDHAQLETASSEEE